MQTETNATETTKTTPPVNAKPKKAPRKVAVKAAKTERVPLKKVVEAVDKKLDTKTARRVLRKAKLGFHTLGGRWELTANQVPKVKEVLRDYVRG